MPYKILIVDDDEEDQKLIKKRLGQIGFDDIDVAKDGEEGVHLAKEINPNLVITDTNLPGIDGHETCRQIKAIEEINPKIIVMTGFIDAIDAGKARQAGADDYVVKSSSVKEILEVVKEIHESTKEA